MMLKLKKELKCRLLKGVIVREKDTTNAPVPPEDSGRQEYLRKCVNNPGSVVAAGTLWII
ncbi:hypothetical protein A8C56_12745 [Niabella ginsenosidivorans]|uniref:Uncharacterized protein n=1 Tax=Niabella ginsenosidivorans TaxID=1176587 RepID=A0A1A9I4V1_9BACT|nr:hypothetical protein A8C56_12745 [Niabella ginsenosidivorans]